MVPRNRGFGEAGDLPRSTVLTRVTAPRRSISLQTKTPLGLSVCKELGNLTSTPRRYIIEIRNQFLGQRKL
jgi:hypothetical protein